MREYPEANYFLSVSPVGESIDLQLGRLLPRSYLIVVNLVTKIAFVSWLPASPWPPPYPTSWDHWRDRDEAAWYLFATDAVTVAPTEEREARIQTVVFDEYPETAHTVFWRPRADYEALLADLERAYGTPDPSELRLDELAEGPLAEFLRHDLPHADLSAYERKILCLASSSDSSS
ncbi:MAG TPA: hypothetical protein VNO30_33485 [Kofleriaceae bacterium]|nr:hypothetical protein [Kofleriaceae bacterium]